MVLILWRFDRRILCIELIMQDVRLHQLMGERRNVRCQRRLRCRSRLHRIVIRRLCASSAGPSGRPARRRASSYRAKLAGPCEAQIRLASSMYC